MFVYYKQTWKEVQVSVVFILHNFLVHSDNLLTPQPFQLTLYKSNKKLIVCFSDGSSGCIFHEAPAAVDQFLSPKSAQDNIGRKCGYRLRSKPKSSH